VDESLFVVEESMEFTIRPGVEEDTPKMLRLWREMMDVHAHLEPRFRPLPAPEGEQAWAQHLREHVWSSQDWCVFVAEADGRLVGQIIGMTRNSLPVFEPERYGYVTDIVVAPAARRAGVGQALFEALKGWFSQRDIPYLQLSVTCSNPASQAFWRTMGCTDYMDTMWYDLEGS
jgi:ribosomal protein S18 acetylase RimI-like enzyme